MPNTKSAAKRVRQDEKKRRANASRKTTVKTALKKMDTLIEEKDAEKAAVQMKAVFQALDKAAKAKVIHKNTAARKKSQIAKKIQKLTQKG